ncbi:MAG: hypothetical protein MJ070_04515 [Lachnospiraceae bacterium]|nr:hypothetical protein [Lachnospiraceae bacterium]
MTLIFLDALTPIEIAGDLASRILPIVIGGVILCAAIAFVIIFIKKKKNKEKKENEDDLS